MFHLLIVIASCVETICHIDIMNNKDKKIIIYGGTGHYGRKVVEKLIQKGKSVKVVSRNETNARKILGGEVEIVEGDVTNQVCNRHTMQM